MKSFLLILILTLPAWMFGCSDNPSKPEKNEKTSTNYISEVYFLHGTIIERSACAPCTGDFERTYDTTNVVTTTSVKYLDENPDSIRFFGLEGADSGMHSVIGPDEFADATYQNAEISMDFFNTGHWYKGNGMLENGQLTVKSFYQYRGDSLGYDFTGRRVEGLGGLGEPEYFKTGLYFVGGEKITTSYSDWPIPEGEEPEIDTVRVDFSMHLKVQDDQEKIRFVGLPGADAGVMENRVYPDCTISEDCIILGRSTGVESFEIDIENNGRIYQANGTARSSNFEMISQYQYQNTTIDYILEGQRYFER